MSTPIEGAGFKVTVRGTDYLAAYVVADDMVHVTAWVAGQWRNTQPTQVGGSPPTRTAEMLARQIIREAT